jgi:hypothetical protein
MRRETKFNEQKRNYPIGIRLRDKLSTGYGTTVSRYRLGRDYDCLSQKIRALVHGTQLTGWETVIRKDYD